MLRIERRGKPALRGHMAALAHLQEDRSAVFDDDAYGQCTNTWSACWRASSQCGHMTSELAEQLVSR